MPHLLSESGFEFFYYSNEQDEPMHLYVHKGVAEGKIRIEQDIEVDYMAGFSGYEISELIGIVQENLERIKMKIV